MNDVDKILKDHQRGHSKFQIENFIIRSQGNYWAQYKQCLLEIDSRINQIGGLKDELELKLINVAKLRKKLCIRSDSRKIKRIKIRGMLRQINQNRSNLASAERELKQFIKIARKIKDELGNLDNGQREKLDCEMWADKINYLIQLDLITQKRISRATAEFFLTMPENIKNRFNKMILPLDTKAANKYEQVEKLKKIE